MMKMVLIEDEPIVRKAILFCVNWEDYDVEIVGEASNGEEGLKKCLECRPDIVITDIRMPQMDGLELVKRLKECLPETKVIILSGYEKFEYAKRAITLGVSEYLLKPVDEDELVAAVRKLQERIQNERKSTKERQDSAYLIKQNLMTLQSEFFHQFLDGKYRKKEDVKAKALKLKIDLSGKRYRAFMMHIDKESLWENEHREEDLNLLHFSICNISEEIMTEKIGKGFLICYGSMDFAGILCMNDLERVSITDLLREIQQKLRKYVKISVSIGVGNSYPDLMDLRQSFREAQKALKNKFYTGHLSLNIFKEGGANGDEEFVYPVQKERQLAQCQNSRDEDGMFQILNQIFKEIQNSCLSEKKAKGECCRLVDMLVKNAEQQRIDSSKCLGKSFNIYADIQELETLVDIKLWVEETIRKLQRELLQRRKYSVIVTNAMEYMGRNYFRDISLPEMADRAGVTPNYFSKVFKEEAGINFVDWLNKLRVEKAIQLLEEGTFKVYEVAEKVGFSDYKYFSAIFKKIMKCTPKQYQNREK